MREEAWPQKPGLFSFAEGVKIPQSPHPNAYSAGCAAAATSPRAARERPVRRRITT